MTENNNDNSKSEQTAAFEMNEASTTQENIPSQAEAKIEISDKTENTASSTETASYSYSGSALGGNARESLIKTASIREQITRTKTVRANRQTPHITPRVQLLIKADLTAIRLIITDLMPHTSQTGNGNLGSV